MALQTFEPRSRLETCIEPSALDAVSSSLAEARELAHQVRTVVRHITGEYPPPSAGIGDGKDPSPPEGILPALRYDAELTLSRVRDAVEDLQRLSSQLGGPR